MKNCAFKTAVVALAFSIFATLGCETVVTDVNAELAAIYPEEDLGIPVKLNENYIEVAYNPSAGTAEDTEEEISEKKEEKTSENTEAVTEDDTNNDEDAEIVSEEDGDSEDTEAEGDDVSDEEDDESEEDSETDGEVAEEDDSDSDLNSSMAEENFDAEFYARTYPDVVAVFGDSAEALYKHYQDYGKAEGRSCNEEEFALLNEAVN